MKKVKDYYFKKAKKEGYPARSVYKLEEAQKKYRFLSKAARVLDLGAYPGSWTKYAAKTVGTDGLVVAVDLKQLEIASENIKVIRGDIFEIPAEELKRHNDGLLFDVVLSDMAPKTTGRKDVDHLKSIALAEQALFLAQSLLTKKGAFFCKVFQGEDFPQYLATLKKSFGRVKVVKPKSSRSESVETFVLCSDMK